jgi:hypothetical protein
MLWFLSRRKGPSMATTTHRPHPLIRPSPEYLKTLRTLRVLTPENGGKAIEKACREHGVDYQIDLKLETEKTRYWVVTRCGGKVLPGWEEGVVFAEDVKPDENGEHKIVPYNPGTLKKLQRFDYLWMLRTELVRLFDEPWSWEREKRIEEVRAEIHELVPVPKLKLGPGRNGSKGIKAAEAKKKKSS